jgi:phosphohistidine phosphatase
MELILIRHGEAVGEAPGLGDAGRFLTEKGRKVTRRVARWLAKKAKRCPAVIWTSPLVRAVQTGEILAEVAGVRAGVQVVAELSPGRDPNDLVALLRAEGKRGPLAVVGHEPSLSLLAGVLLGGATLPGFKKSGVVAIELEDDGARFGFAYDPKKQACYESIAELRAANATPA